MRAARLALLGAAGLLAACRQDMHDTPRYEPYEQSDFFGDQRAARPLVEGVVARGDLRDDDELYTGKVAGAFTAVFPVPVTHELVVRGQDRFRIYCTPCHGQVGRGDGMVVRRGYRRPTSFHDERLRQQPAGYFFDVMTNGFGVMPDYRAQIPRAEDRWAIVAYIRALQLSQNASVDDLGEDERAKLGAPGMAPQQRMPEAGTLPPVSERNPLEDMHQPAGAQPPPAQEHHP